MGSSYLLVFPVSIKAGPVLDDHSVMYGIQEESIERFTIINGVFRLIFFDDINPPRSK